MGKIITNGSMRTTQGSGTDLTSYSLAATALAAVFGSTQNVEAIPVVYDNGGLGWTAGTSDLGLHTVLSLNLAGQVSTDGSSVADEQFRFEHGFSSWSS